MTCKLASPCRLSPSLMTTTLRCQYAVSLEVCGLPIFGRTFISYRPHSSQFLLSLFSGERCEHPNGLLALIHAPENIKLFRVAIIYTYVGTFIFVQTQDCQTMISLKVNRKWRPVVILTVTSSFLIGDLLHC